MQSPGLVGTRVDRYELGRLLGSGGFGAVYLAKHVHTDATVALKLLKRSLGADQQMLERFLREARAAASVGSENIVRVMDAGLAADGQAFLALEFLDGLDLKELALQQGPIPPQRLVMVVLQALEALSAAHAKGIVHRDMKPANVFVVRRRDERGLERDFVKLLDFGISKMHGDASTAGLTMTGVAMGTPSYMAPEQFFDARSVDARADLYSVAAMMYELLSGRLPFDAESYAHLIVKVRTEMASPLNQIAPQVPIALAQVVMVGLAKEPQQRWQSAREFGDALRSAMGLPPPGSTPAFLPSQSSVQAAFAPVAPEGLDKTHTPQPRPSQPLQPVAPAPSAPPPATPVSQSAAWVVPSSGSANTGLPLNATPHQQPGQQHSGWVLPGATPAPSVLQANVNPPQYASPPPPGKTSGWKWVIGTLGVLFLMGGCCTCVVIGEAASAASSIDRTQPARVQNVTPTPTTTRTKVDAPDDPPEATGLRPLGIDPVVEPDAEPEEKPEEPEAESETETETTGN